MLQFTTEGEKVEVQVSKTEFYIHIHLDYVKVEILFCIKENVVIHEKNCKDSICNDPKLVLGSYVKTSNNKIRKAWAERLGLGHRTVFSHGFHGRHTEVNHVCPRGLSP